MQRISDMLGKVIDSYKIEAVLGKGGMGVVYKAVDTSLDKVVALKVMNPLLSEDERFLGRFKSEAKALGRLHHPNIVSVFALRHVDHHLFIVMEFVEGETLADVLVRLRGPMPWQDVLPILMQTLRAIDYAHNEQIIHRDIKPHNIMLTHEGRAKVTDFGLAKIQAAHSDSVMATRTGFTGGTLYYMPPEQLEGLLHVDHHGDIYGLGMTFYELLAGRTPFDKLSSEFAILKAIDAHDIPLLHGLNPDVPAPLSAIVMKAIERYPRDRYGSAGAMLADLQAWQDGKPITAQADRSTTPVPRTAATAVQARRKRTPHDALKPLKAALAKGAGWYASVLQKSRLKAARGDSVAAKTVLTADPLPAAPRLPLVPPLSDEPPLPLHEPTQQELAPLGPPSQQEPPVQQDAPPQEERAPAAPPVAQETPPPKPPSLAAPRPAPSRSPRSRADRRRPPRGVLMAGAAAAFLLVVFLGYLGTQGAFTGASAEGDAAEALETALLSIHTVPVEAAVFVDGQPVGNTPLVDYEVAAGTTAVRIEKPGYVALDTALTLAVNQAPFTFELLEEASEAQEDAPVPQAVAMLTVRSDPDGADVFLDGENVGQTPLTLQDPETGERNLVVRKRGYSNYTHTIQIKPGIDNRVTATLAALVGTMQITVRPFGDIYIDNIMKAQGSAEPYSETLGGGTYRVRVQHPEYGTWERAVTIDTSGTKAVLFNFDQELELAVTSEPDRADILVDGEPLGEKTPGVVRVRPGRRTIAVRRRGFVMEGAAQILTLERSRADRPLHFTLRAVEQ